MGEVYLGRHDDRADSLVVVKLVRADLAHDRLFRDRFAAEVAASQHLASLEGTFVPRLVDADTSAARPWLASEFVPGPSVAEAAAGAGLPADEVERIAASLAEALAALHSHGLIHGDVTPSNVVLGPDGVRLIDLGLVRTVDEPVAPGARLGSPGWCAPEVMSGRPASPASDVHGWGCTVAYAASGASPFGTGGHDVVHLRMQSGSPRLDALPRSLRPVVDKALCPEPLLRPTADELHDALSRTREPALVGAGVAATAPLLLEAATQALVAPTRIEPGPLLPWEPTELLDDDDPVDSRRDRRALFGVAAVLAAVLGAGVVWSAVMPDGGGAAESATVPGPSASASASSSARSAAPATTAPTRTAAAVPAAAPAAQDPVPAAKAKGKGKEKGKDKGRGKGGGKG
jgi:serine/threonine protein kinase